MHVWKRRIAHIAEKGKLNTRINANMMLQLLREDVCVIPKLASHERFFSPIEHTQNALISTTVKQSDIDDFEIRVEKLMANRTRTARIQLAIAILSEYKILRIGFISNSQVSAFKLQTLRDLTSLTFIPSCLSLKEKQLLFLMISFDVAKLRGKVAFVEFKELITRTSIMSCLETDDGVEKSLKIAKFSGAHSSKILHALVFLRTHTYGANNASEWMYSLLPHPQDVRQSDTHNLKLKWTTESCNLILSHIGRNNEAINIMDFSKFFEKMQTLNLVNRYSWNYLIAGYIRLDDIDSAKRFLGLMHQSHLKPNLTSYGTIIRGILLSSARKIWNFKSSNSSLLLIRNLLDMQELITQTSENAANFNSANKIAVTLTQNALAEANTYIKLMKEAGYSVDVWTKNALLSFYMLQKDYDKVESLYFEMQIEGHKCDLKSHAILLNSYFKSENIRAAIDLLAQLVEIDVTFDQVMYGTCMAGFHRLNQPLRALEYYKQLCDRGFHPSYQDYHVLFDIFCKRGDFDTAHKLCSNLLDDGYRVSEITLGIFINGYGKMGDIEMALEVFNSIPGYGIKRTSKSYNTMISVLFKNDRFSDGIELLDEMVACGIKPDQYTSQIAMGGYARTGDEQSLIQAFEKHIELGLIVNAQSLNPLILYYSNNLAIEKVSEILVFLKKISTEMPGLDHSPRYSHTHVLKSLMENNDYAKIQDYFERIETKSQNSTNFDIYIRALAKLAQYDHCSQVFWERIVTQIVPDSKLYQTFIKEMFRCDRKTDCWFAYRHMICNGIPPSVKTAELMKYMKQNEEASLEIVDSKFIDGDESDVPLN